MKLVNTVIYNKNFVESVKVVGLTESKEVKYLDEPVTIKGIFLSKTYYPGFYWIERGFISDKIIGYTRTTPDFLSDTHGLVITEDNKDYHQHRLP